MVSATHFAGLLASRSVDGMFLKSRAFFSLKGVRVVLCLVFVQVCVRSLSSGFWFDCFG